jgi:hypothetical protein
MGFTPDWVFWLSGALMLLAWVLDTYAAFTGKYDP